MPDYTFPVQGYHGPINLHWGDVTGGSDIFAPRGTPVVAMEGGTVLQSGWDNIGGNSVLIRGLDNLMYYYAHLDASPAVQVGQQIASGTFLGPLGESGNAAGTGPHLHIGIGPSILTGNDKFGGTGGTFDAVGLLRSVLTGIGSIPGQISGQLQPQANTTTHATSGSNPNQSNLNLSFSDTLTHLSVQFFLVLLGLTLLLGGIYLLGSGSK